MNGKAVSSGLYVSRNFVFLMKSDLLLLTDWLTYLLIYLITYLLHGAVSFLRS